MHFEEWMERVVQAFEVAGVGILAIGSLAALVGAAAALSRGERRVAYERARQDVGRAVLLGLEVLIIADIVQTITIDATIESAVTLALIVLVRTFLSFSLEIELEGVVPWQSPHGGATIACATSPAGTVLSRLAPLADDGRSRSPGHAGELHVERLPRSVIAPARRRDANSRAGVPARCESDCPPPLRSRRRHSSGHRQRAIGGDQSRPWRRPKSTASSRATRPRACGTRSRTWVLRVLSDMYRAAAISR